MTILNGIFKTYDLSDSFFNHCINDLGAGVHLVPVSLSVVRRTTRDNIVDIRFCYNHRDPLPFPRSLHRALVKNFPTSYSACFLEVRIYPCGGIRIYNIIFEDATYAEDAYNEVPLINNRIKVAKGGMSKRQKDVINKEIIKNLRAELYAERDKIRNNSSLNTYQKRDLQYELTRTYRRKIEEATIK